MNNPPLKSHIHSDNLYILGAWLSYERNRQNYSLRGLARGANVAGSLISAIENQKTKANLDTLKYLFEALNHTFITEEDRLNSVLESIDALYYAVYDQNHAMVPKLFDGIKEHLKTLKYSPISVDLILVESFMHIHFGEGRIPEAFDALFNHENYLSTAQRQRLYLNQGYIEFHHGDYRAAEKTFNRVLSLHRSSRAHAVALTMLAQIKYLDFKLFEALESAKEASILHAQYSNLFRKVEVDFMLIQIYISMNHLHQAASIIQNLSYVLVESNYHYWQELQAFKAYVAYRQGDYQASVQTLATIEELNPLQTVLLAQSNVHLNQHSKALSLYEALIKQSTLTAEETSMIRMLLTQFEGHDLNPDDLTQLLNAPKQFMHLHIVQTLIDVLNDYAYKHHKHESLYKLQKLSLKLMNYE